MFDYFKTFLDPSLAEILKGHTGPITSLVLLENGNLASGSDDSTVKIWNTANFSLVKNISTGNDGIIAMASLKNGCLAVSVSDKIQIWHIEDASLLRTMQVSNGYATSLLELPSGELASGASKGVIQIWNVNNGTLRKTLRKFYSKDLKITLIPLLVLENGYLATSDRVIKIWDTGVVSIKITIETNNTFYSLAQLHSGYLAGGCVNGSIIIWNTTTGGLVKVLNGHTKQVRALKVLPNGFLASGSVDSSIKIWNVNSGSLVREIKDKNANIFSLELLKNGFLASVSGNDIKIWSLDDLTEYNDGQYF